MIDSFETMKAELDEGGELLRQHYPDDDERQLLNHAMFWRRWRYQHSRWPSDQEIIEEKAKAAAVAKAYADAVAKARAEAETV
jgi:hypothetical protein